MQMSRLTFLALPLAATLVAGCAHKTAGNARDAGLPPAPAVAPAPTTRALPPAPALSEAPVPAPVNAPRPGRSATR